MSRLRLFVGDNFAACGVCGRLVLAPYWLITGKLNGVRVHARCWRKATIR